jgi:hypothetical protein
MTFKQKYQTCKTWQERALVINLYFRTMDARMDGKPRNERPSVRSVARYFDISIGRVSEDLRLADKIDKVRGCKTRSDALLVLKS